MRARGLFLLTAMLAAGGCDYIASPDDLLDPDAISIAMILVAGERQAHLLAGHPHRTVLEPPPTVTATLVGPGWRAALTHDADLDDGCGGGPTDWPMPKVCLNAELPEPIRNEATYRLEGVGPKGSFTGEAVVPAAPTIQAPVDTVWLPGPQDAIRIPIRYHASAQVGTLRPEVLQTVGGSTGTRSEWVNVIPRNLDVSGREETIKWSYERNLQRASLHLLGIGQLYTLYWKLDGTHIPWPKAGVSGNGVYGYFDGSAKSRPIEIRLKDEG
ncbi:MAG: hypothetical protein OXQ94_11755 [Gemmatimonadota bacterium]|nr:hypothetical protein [Gemmatimonadota bacterium]MDE2872343.1 hypothetical protein [Gemmatimonadota bacterium]